VPDFLAALSAGDVYLPAARGNPRLDEPAQAAELAVMRWGAARGHAQASARLDSRVELDGDHMLFEAVSGNEPVTVAVAIAVFAVDGACDNIGVEPPGIERRWLAGAVTARGETTTG